MNIIYLVSDLRSAGPTNQAFNLVTGLARYDCNVFLVTLYEERRDSWMDRFIKANVQIYQLHASKKHLKRAAKNLETFIIKNKVQILHSSGMSADFVNRFVKVPVLKMNTVRQEFYALSERRNYLIKLISRYVTLTNHKAMDVRVACSKALQLHLEQYAKMQYEYVENGVDIDKFKPLSIEAKQDLRKSLGISTDVTVYLTVGVLYSRKQTASLVKCFMKSNLKNAILVIVGDGDEMDEIKTLSVGNDTIKIIGKVQEPLPYYQCADIFVSASLAEGLPNTVMEAMACGLPCILSDIGPHKEILDYNEEAGTLFETKNYNLLTECLKETQTWNLDERSKSANQLVNENLSKYCTATNYYNLYMRYLNGK